jgi:uncharacterized BrkB/YihY/UPF0761 family membrane protein
MRRVLLFLRGALPLLLLGLAMVGGPTLLAWWLMGGPLGWPHLLAGALGGAALLLVGGLIFGWALGRKIGK